MEEKLFSVYTLSDPRTSQVRYVGISCEVENRYQAHLTSSQNASKIAWVQELKASQLLPILSIIETGLTFEGAKARELDWIRHYLESGMPLVNISGVTKPWVGGVSMGTKSRPVSSSIVPLLDVTDVAKKLLEKHQLKLSPDHIKKLLRDGDMPGYKMEQWRVSQDELEQWVEERKTRKPRRNRYKPSQES